ncbi:hypothetical protein IMZ48_43125 [Candidatus Bathyarchaeota archaeon]|nr:hypothetical protein [Candidatus Bathyarchaeota archaeon]
MLVLLLVLLRSALACPARREWLRGRWIGTYSLPFLSYPALGGPLERLLTTADLRRQERRCRGCGTRRRRGGPRPGPVWSVVVVVVVVVVVSAYSVALRAALPSRTAA